MFEELKEKAKELNETNERLKEERLKSVDIIAENAINVFDKFAMTNQKREDLKNMEYVTDGLFVDGYHSYLFGASGSGKTTIMLNLGLEMAERGYKVHFFYLDGELFSASKVSAEIDDRNIANNYQILTDGTMQDYTAVLQSFIDTKVSLKKTVFILDTFKFLSDDINNKNANKRAMHFIKNICKLGATFISLGHTNKDGKKQSGTAEIEQDSDALLQIDTVVNASDGKYTSTIKKGGRCRCTITERSFEFVGGEPLSVTPLDKVVNVEKINTLEAMKEKDKKFIQEVTKLLYDGGEKMQKELLELLNDFGLGRDKIIQKLKQYVGDKWEERSGEKNTSIYFLKDDFIQQWKKLDKDTPINKKTT